MVTTGAPILYVLTIPGSVSPDRGWVFLSLHSTPPPHTPLPQEVGSSLSNLIVCCFILSKEGGTVPEQTESLGRQPEILYYEQTKGQGTSKHPFQMTISALF